MSINIFFISIFTLLLIIFFGFKPLDIKPQEFLDVPVFQIKTFTLHELNKKGLITLMKGDEALRYTDRYRVKGLDYTDNSRKYIANMRADNGVYRDQESTLDLDGNVLYNREDGLIFKTDEASYNKKTSIANTKSNYVLYRDTNIVTGNNLEYNNQLNKIKSKNIVAKYQLQESN
ncbi:MAG: LPS export ABC transporter periplasmic protein LptC [Campylobacterota bacterium]|nr:LPS export ABC transporter periplasmic protein LptC [Campylobacterota bacterium]